MPAPAEGSYRKSYRKSPFPNVPVVIYSSPRFVPGMGVGTGVRTGSVCKETFMRIHKVFLPLLAMTAIGFAGAATIGCHAEADAKVGGATPPPPPPAPPPPPPPAGPPGAPPAPAAAATQEGDHPQRCADEVGDEDRHARRYRIPERQREDRLERQVQEGSHPAGDDLEGQRGDHQAPHRRHHRTQ